MKKVLLLLICLFCLCGCTINIGETKEKKTNVKGTSVEEKVESKGVASTKDNPLSIGGIGRCSKFNEINDDYSDIDIKLIKKVDDFDLDSYNEKHPDETIEVKNNFELVAFKYEVTLIDFDTESFGTDSIVDIEVTNDKDGIFIVDQVKQVITIYNVEKTNGIVNNKKGTGIILFQIPKDTKSYFIKFGTAGHTIAYYKIG